MDFHFLERFDKGKKYSANQIGLLLEAGDEVLVQVKKGPVGSKGARLTGRLHIPGKYMVFLPQKRNIAISRKISSSKDRANLKNLISQIKRADCGIIVRTDSKGMSEDELKQEYKVISKIWDLIEKQSKFAKSPVCLYNDNDISYTLIRDLFDSKVTRVIVDDKKFRDIMVNRLKQINPELIGKIELYSQDSPIFDVYSIEKEIEKIFMPRIYLPSGGNITIDHTEALTAIDVNTGKFIGKTNYEETIKKTNVEAAIEVAKQIKLRDISGIIIVDFIDMLEKANQEEVMATLKKDLKYDRGKSKVYPFTHLGLVEISRKHLRQNILTRYSYVCPHCKGRGRIFTPKSVIIKINRWMQRAEFFIGQKPIIVYVNPEIIMNEKELSSYFSDTFKMELKADSSLYYEEFRVVLKETGKEITEEYNS